MLTSDDIRHFVQDELEILVDHALKTHSRILYAGNSILIYVQSEMEAICIKNKYHGFNVEVKSKYKCTQSKSHVNCQAEDCNESIQHSVKISLQNSEQCTFE